MPGIDVVRLMDELGSSRKVTVLAYAPHVHEQKLDQARQAGCDQVLTRGEIHRRIGEILTALSG